MIRIKNIKQKVFQVFLYGFAIVGVIFAGVFIAMQTGLLNVKGSISERNSYFKRGLLAEAAASRGYDLVTMCQINILSEFAPITATNIYETLGRGTENQVITQMILLARKRFDNDPSFRILMDNCEVGNSQSASALHSAYNWADTDEWNLMKEVFARDKDVIEKAAKDAGISPRLILSGVIGEQFRFFSSRRETFKSYFEPLKILATLSNTSYGIAGLKPKTVESIETNLKDTTSPFYLGLEMEHVADYDPSDDVPSVRLSRITDAKNSYYSYLYVGLFMKEIESQWQRAGYNIDNRPDVLATLYNLGFYYSIPKEDPKIGGTIINIGGASYAFGDVAYEFYYSGELSDIFPLAVQ